MIVRDYGSETGPLFRALAIDKMYGHGPTNEMHSKLQPKKTKVRLYWPLLKQ